MTARANARFGDLAGAQAMADEMPSDCYPCVRPPTGWGPVFKLGKIAK
jgi:hypothetical protein